MNNTVFFSSAVRKYLATSLLVFTSTFAAFPLTLNFDALSTVAYPPIPDGYGGLQWNNFSVVDGDSQYLSSGFYNVMRSAPNVAFNLYGEAASISSPAGFTLSSGYFAAGWIDGLILEVKGFVGAGVAFDNTYTLHTAQATLINFNYVGVNEVDFIPVNPPAGTAPGTQFAMDNLTIFVPEPTASVLIGVGSVFVFWRRKQPPRQS